MIADAPDAPEAPVSPAALPRDMRVIEAAELFRGGKEIAILHEGSVYRMKITRQGKLILNK
ncbi:MAG: hemic uptake protein hemP [Rhizobiales bacterium 63-7]|uniref:hemin uptake protein HemP n=1 Tax=Rhizobium sp. YJ-22 TaxID=3037556 RepID=UPI000929F36B|nr:hemin uptake protein HemP [Rhizobium sp. YJ-22]MBN9031977.1 hemin uptake protein HemP [Hyphomicrobiales bacterium]MDG3576227.1 hemin uptake protein HemP [Rhizobium sp. YJ-22]OJU70989.1 MAG: hemic uptake protein hemP [Rhizobiales bacterium 63-7]